MSSMKFAKWVFTIAGVYGIVGLAPQYFMESRIGRDFPPAITHPEHFYGFVGVALAWQILFLLIARDPVRLRPAMLPGILEKLSFGIAALILFMQGRVAALMVVFGVIDLLFATLFFIAWRKTERA
jgi:hypothetical protein